MKFCGVEKRLLFRCSSAALLAILLIILISPSRHHRSFVQIQTASRGSSAPKAPSQPQDALQISSNTVATNPADPFRATPSATTDTAVEDISFANHHNNSPVDTASRMTSAPPSTTHRSQLHLVIAHHNEEPFWMRRWIDSVRSIPYIKELGIKVIIYTKSQETDLVTLQETTAVDEVFRLPNVGREGSTYLHHLLMVYDDPPPFTMFTQAIIKKGQYLSGEIEDEKVAKLKDWIYEKLSEKFTSDIGFMSLDRKHDICYCGHCTDMGREDFYPLWPQLYAILEGKVCQELEGSVLSFNGHFIVSRKRILSRPKSTYEYLKELVDAPQDHWLHTEPEPKWFEKEKGKSTSDNPKFGHTLERLWHVIFNCSDPAQMVDCDVKGMKAEGPGGCTCKDILAVPIPASAVKHTAGDNNSRPSGADA